MARFTFSTEHSLSLGSSPRAAALLPKDLLNLSWVPYGMCCSGILVGIKQEEYSKFRSIRKTVNLSNLEIKNRLLERKRFIQLNIDLWILSFKGISPQPSSFSRFASFTDSSIRRFICQMDHAQPQSGRIGAGDFERLGCAENWCLKQSQALKKR